MESYRQRFDDAPSKINNEQEKSVLVTKNSGVSGNSLVFGADKEVMFGNLLNADCILLPHCGTSSSHQKLWSQALLANRISSSAEVGLIESHGSLWRFVPFVEGDNSRVILQNSERGEPALYLSQQLDLVDMKVDAALWRLRQSTSSPSSAPEDGSRGVVVVLEMLGTEGQQQLQAQAHTQPPLDKSVTVPVLVCETSRELQSYSELFVEPASLRFGPSGDSGPVTVSGVAAGAAAGSAEEGAHPTYRSCEWEVVLDAWLEAQTDALDFLQGFIN